MLPSVSLQGSLIHDLTMSLMSNFLFVRKYIVLAHFWLQTSKITYKTAAKAPKCTLLWCTSSVYPNFASYWLILKSVWELGGRPPKQANDRWLGLGTWDSLESKASSISGISHRINRQPNIKEVNTILKFSLSIGFQLCNSSSLLTLLVTTPWGSGEQEAGSAHSFMLSIQHKLSKSNHQNGYTDEG